MPKILVLNNYPLDAVWDEVRRGDTPDHLLFGINYFSERGYECEILPAQEGAPVSSINRWLQKLRFPLDLGDIAQQREVLKRVNQSDLIYAACGTQTSALACLRGLGLFHKPIVCVVHHPLNQGRLTWLRKPFLKMVKNGTDAFACLSHCVSEEIGPKAQSLPWGPDAKFYPQASRPGQGAVAFGRTGRDFITFGKGASAAGVPGKIICTENYVTREYGEFGRNVEVLSRPVSKEGWMTYPEINAHLLKARVVAIPLTQQTSLAGLTSLLDALGLGRPVIMTRNKHINLDIEAEGIGRWVEPGDVQGWATALKWFESHPDEAQEMGRRAREKVDSGFSSVAFANRLMDIFDQILCRTKA